MKTKKTHIKKVACFGCGRHAREIDDKVVSWFCHHCFMETGNYNRYRAGLPTVKPLENIKVKDRVIGVDGDEYVICGRGELIDEDRYYPVKNLKTKKERIAGDFFFVRKVVK